MESHEGRVCQVSEDERKLLEEELGFVPNNLMCISAWTKTMTDEVVPAVAQLYPLRNCEDAYKAKQRAKVEPFPTIYWLVSKELKARVSVLEDQGYVLRLQERLRSNPEEQKRMDACHEAYARERWESMTEHDLELVKRRQWTFPLRDVGVAGIRRFDSVKCLHTHYAHYLATKQNVIGEWVQELLDSQELSTSSDDRVEG